jgi:hypothetical protein
MSALTATLPKLVDDVEPTPRTELVLESAPSAAKIDERSAPGLITEREVVFNTNAIGGFTAEAAALSAPKHLAGRRAHET